MGLLTGWITGLVLLIMLAILLEMLLPNSSMRGYVKMVISLLILIAMLKPILSIFTVDSEEWIRNLQTGDQYQTESIETQINLQKSGLDEVRAAYISEQVADQLVDKAEETLRDTYSLEFASVDVMQEMGQGGQEDEEAVSIHAVVREIHPQQNTDAVRSEIKRVQIDLSKQQPSKESDSIDLLPVINYLSDSWEIPESITLLLEGGEQVDG
ncbi:stage III sporulation protein AF [Alkalicoccobacillus plakortidis]|uniref:Stage III sporulation protein AF n=1 Tax=Alkalicoccobacillus plakortidis TaxID=444060 RepID=A0ABT0XGF4_9BACI|nr:stage III sporulation protein AF [Alkalicoccobacillus plakortidis]MCM2674978.1 stage III sporulation protein AF [Alkalicoccobacillus plakortidis]